MEPSRLLTRQGAESLRVERPGGEASRPRHRSPRRAIAIRPSERDFMTDLLMLALAALAEIVTAAQAGVPVEAAHWLVAFPLLSLALLARSGIYRQRTGPRYLDDVRTVIAASAVAAMSLTFVRVLLADDPYAASQAVREWLFASVYLGAGRAGVQLADLRLRRLRGAGSPTLILGAGLVGHLIARRLLAAPQIGLRPVGFVDDDPREVSDGAPVPVLGGPDQVEAIVREYAIEHAILSFSTASHQTDLSASRRLRELGVSVSIVPRLFEDIPDRMALERIGGLPLISVYPSNPRGWQFAVKYAADRVLATLLLVIASPLLAAIALGTLATLGRPVLFRQRRAGLDGRQFEMLKFRTMRGGADHAPERAAVTTAFEHGLGPGGVEGEDRRTRLGAFLRGTSLDELPQLLNVVRGQMSLVGPRPERGTLVESFTGRVYRYGDRHRVKSGITGWAQVHGLRGRTSLADRVEWDNYYIENWSLWLDLKILAMTVIAVFRDRSE